MTKNKKIKYHLSVALKKRDIRTVW